MSVRHGLLALLADEPQHGYALKVGFEGSTGGAWLLNIGQVYTTLSRLERDGLVSSLDGAEDGRQRYRITPHGREKLEAWFIEPVVPHAPPRDEVAIKLLLAIASADVDVTALIGRQRSAAVEQLQQYTRQKRLTTPDELPFLLLLDALILQAEAQIRWLDICEARLRGRPHTSRRTTAGTPDGISP